MFDDKIKLNQFYAKDKDSIIELIKCRIELHNDGELDTLSEGIIKNALLKELEFIKNYLETL